MREEQTVVMKKYVNEVVSGAVEMLRQELDRPCESTQTTYDPPKVDKVAHYLHLLFEAQKSGHDVHREIEDALKQFKQESGI